MTTIDQKRSEARPVRLRIEGMHCAGCVANVESALRGVEGVSSASVSLPDASAVVQAEGVELSALLEAVRKRGFGAERASDRQSVAERRTEIEERDHERAEKWRLRMIVGAVCLVVLAFLHWGGPLVGLHHHMGWPLWAMAGLATVVQVYVGSAFYASAWTALRARTANMDTLVSMAATAAYVFSMVAFVLTLAGVSHELPNYFKEAAGLLTFIAIGHWLEARATASAGSAVRELLSLQPDTVTRIESEDASDGESVVSADVRPGELLLVRPGERVAVDGEIVRGASALDESVITGESMPVEREVGQQVVAGSLNVSGRLVVRATTDGRDTTVARIAALVRDAQSSKAKIQKLADRVSAVFVPTSLVIAAVTLLGWGLLGGEQSWVLGVVYATTVLVISCPCALGLATPTAVMAGSGSASRLGILVKSATALERLSRVDTLFLDKTGTLTEGRPRVVETDLEGEALGMAAALAGASNHPLSRAVVEYSREVGVEAAAAEDVQEEAGTGIRGRVDGARVELISLRAAGARELGGLDGQEPAGTVSVLVRDDVVVGRFVFRDPPREDARSMIEQVRGLGVRPVLLTGDTRAAAAILAEEVGLDVEREVHAQLSPSEKVDHVRRAGDEGRIGAMVGDGINDAAALAAAGASGGVGVAIRTGSNIAVESADVVIPGHQLAALPDLLRVGRLTMGTIKQNLFLSFLYNGSAIPAAALGLLGMHGPLVAAIAMGLSSVCVVGNSLRLGAKLRRRSRAGVSAGV